MEPDVLTNKGVKQIIAFGENALSIIKQGGVTGQVLNDFYRKNQERKLSNFLENVDLCFDTMSEQDCNKLRKKIQTEIGRKLLSEYVVKSLETDSAIARMVLALLYCEDPDFQFDEVRKKILISATQYLDDVLINFYILVNENQTVSPKNLSDLPYDRVGLFDGNVAKFEDNGWDKELITANVHQLMNLRLLLPDPCGSNPYVGRDASWMVEFGISDGTRKMASLFDKARLMQENRIQNA